MITEFTCTCGASKPTDAKFYDGWLGYEAIVCKRCGRYYDHNGEHPADDFSKQFVNLKTTFMDTKPFDHGFTKETMLTKTGAAEVIGYNRALIQVIDYIKGVTDFKPENRYIDSVPLLEIMNATGIELNAIYESLDLDDDKKKVDTLSGTKPDQ